MMVGILVSILSSGLVIECMVFDVYFDRYIVENSLIGIVMISVMIEI